MTRLTLAGRTLFSIAIIGLGAEHLIFQEFVTGRAPRWPDDVPGGSAWAVLTGIALIGAGAAILSGRAARLAAVSTATLIFAWAFLRQIPTLAADSLLAPSWTDAGKALTLSGGALVVAATLPAFRHGRRDHVAIRPMNGRSSFIAIGRITLGAFLILTGIQHYLYTEFVATLVPGWMPGGGLFWTHAAGVFLIAGGVGLQLRPTAPLAALLSGLMVFSWFWIVHLPRTFEGRSAALAIFEALAVAGIAFALAGYLHRRRPAGERLGSPLHWN